MNSPWVDLAIYCEDFKLSPSCQGLPNERCCMFCLNYYGDNDSMPIGRWYCHIEGKEAKRRLAEVALYKGQTKLVVKHGN